ncbi:energy transducer TonB [Pedobacter aquatilis]|uniref:energy transducer TonB n=1 Tax=Pedobacter aquatilis TaxID=351343 RepID=UPI0025B55DC4|nr:energy transducer TonB [Pedobacter aquatilis]MDN3587733.1 energy transducer TonB [Pedobacter aquatilis]
MKRILLLLFSFISLSAFAQQSDTLYSYTNINGKGVKKLEKASNIYKIYKGDSAAWIKVTSDKDLKVLKKETFSDSKLSILNGSYIEYQQEKIMLAGSYILGNKTGLWVRNYPEGQIMESETYSKNILNGPFTSYFPSGKIMEQGNYADGKMTGDWKLFSEEGQLVSVKVFRDGILSHPDIVNVKLLDLTPPQFPGGIKMFYQYLSRNIRYPAEALSARLTGKVYFLLTIDKEGYPKDFKVISSPGDILTAEAKRVVMMSPKWIPATENGKPVDMKQNLNISFSLN